MQVLKAGHDQAIASVAMSACGRWLAVARYTIAVEVYDRDAGLVVFTHEGRSGTWGTAFEYATGSLVVWGNAGLSVYGPPTFRPVQAWPDSVPAVAVGGGWMAVATMRDGWSWAELTCGHADDNWRPAWTRGLNRGNPRLAFAPDGRYLAVQRGELAVVSTSDGSDLHAAPGPMHATLLGLLDDRRVVVGVDGFVQLYDVATTRTIAALKLPGGGPVRAAVGPDGRSLVACTRLGVFLLSVEPLAVITRYKFPTLGKPTCVAFAPDGLTAACGTSKGEVVVWDVD